MSEQRRKRFLAPSRCCQIAVACACFQNPIGFLSFARFICVLHFPEKDFCKILKTILRFPSNPNWIDREGVHNSARVQNLSSPRDAMPTTVVVERGVNFFLFSSDQRCAQGHCVSGLCSPSTKTKTKAPLVLVCQIGMGWLRIFVKKTQTTTKHVMC